MLSATLTLNLLPALLPLLIVAGCREPATELPTVKMTLGGKPFTIEVARTDGQRQRGLMYRESLPSDHGMIFIFEEDSTSGFWMKNTRIPLDLIYLDAAGKIVSIHPLKPYDTRTVYAAGPYRYAIELNQGTAAKLGLKSGDAVALPKEVTGK